MLTLRTDTTTAPLGGGTRARRMTKIMLGVAACAILALGAPALGQAQVPPPPPPPPEVGSEPDVIAGDPPVPSPASPDASDALPNQPGGSEPPPQGGQPSSPPPTADPTNPASNWIAAVTLRRRSLRVRVGCMADGSVTVHHKGKRVGAAKFVCNRSTGLARVELSRTVARKLRRSEKAPVRISVSSGGQTATRAMRLRNGSLAPTAAASAAAAGVDRWDEWFRRAITTAGDLGLAWVYYLKWDTSTGSYWALRNKQDCTWALSRGSCGFYTATYYLYWYDYPNRRWLGAYGPYCLPGYACFG